MQVAMAFAFRSLLVAGLLTLSVAGLHAQEAAATKPTTSVSKDGGAVTAIYVKRAILVEGAPIDNAVLLIQDGKIVGLGKEGELDVPQDAKAEDLRAWTVMPGMVNCASLEFQKSTRFSTSGRSRDASSKVSEKLIPRRSRAEAMAKAGFTTLCIVPSTGGFAGLGCLVQPPKSEEGDLLEVSDLLVEDDVVLFSGFAPGTASKKVFVDTLAKARKYITDLAAYEKSKSSKSKSDAKPKKADAKKESKKSDDKKGAGKKDAKKQSEKSDGAEKKDEKKEDAKPKKPKEDSKLMPLVHALESKLPAILQLDNATSFLHFQEVLKNESAYRPALFMPGRGFRSPADPWRILDELESLKVPLVMHPIMGTKPRSQTRRVTPRQILDRGIPVAFVPLSTPAGISNFPMRLLELVRHGVREEAVMRAVTLTPAEILGIQDRFGSLALNKQADLVFFDGDPFAPTSQLMRTMVKGKSVYDLEEMP